MRICNFRFGVGFWIWALIRFGVWKMLFLSSASLVRLYNVFVEHSLHKPSFVTLIGEFSNDELSLPVAFSANFKSIKAVRVSSLI